MDSFLFVLIRTQVTGNGDILIKWPRKNSASYEKGDDTNEIQRIH